MPTTDRRDAGQPQVCTREDHEQMKRDVRAFRRGTRKLRAQGNGKHEPELRNCMRCGSTLTAPPKDSSATD